MALFDNFLAKARLHHGLVSTPVINHTAESYQGKWDQDTNLWDTWRFKRETGVKRPESGVTKTKKMISNKESGKKGTFLEQIAQKVQALNVDLLEVGWSIKMSLRAGLAQGRK